MKFARNFKGLLVDAAINNIHGNFICPQCHHLAHWRKESVDQRRPHFYHVEANEGCPLSVIGGKWELLENEDVEFSSELKNEQFVYQKKVIPNLSKIPSKILADPEIKNQISLGNMDIRLTSTDNAQIDFTVSLLCNVIKKQKVSSFSAIPLPVKIVSSKGINFSKQRIHRRLIRVIGSTPKLVGELSLINIPVAVNIEFGTYLHHKLSNFSRKR
jgi:ribosomal protein S10